MLCLTKTNYAYNYNQHICLNATTTFCKSLYNKWKKWLYWYIHTYHYVHMQVTKTGYITNWL